MNAMSESQGSEGLTAAQAAQRLLENGPNALPASRPLSAWRLLLDVVSEPMFLLLVACGVIYLLLGDRNEALMLLGFVARSMTWTWIVYGILYVLFGMMLVIQYRSKLFKKKRK